MREKTLEKNLNELSLNSHWTWIGTGSYNRAFIAEPNWKLPTTLKAERVVLKLPIPDDISLIDNALCAPSRIARKWATINPHFPIHELVGYQIILKHWNNFEPSDIQSDYIYVSEHKNNHNLMAVYRTNTGSICIEYITDLPEQISILTSIKENFLYLSIEDENALFKKLNLPRQGLLVPFVEGEAPTDSELAHKIIDIYLKTRTIIADAYVQRNFFCDPHTGEVTCIDFDHAMHRDSPASQAFLGRDPYHQFLVDYDTDNTQYPKTVHIIQALFYMEKYIPESQILDIYITQDILLKIYKAAEKKIPLTDDYLRNLSATPSPRTDLLSQSIFCPIHEKAIPVSNSNNSLAYSTDSDK